MGIFFHTGKVSAEKAARQCMAYVQVLFVQKMIGLAGKQDKNPDETGGAALLHGIAYLFLEVEKLCAQGSLTEETVIRLKEEIIQANLIFGFKKEEITTDKLEILAHGIYGVIGQLGCDGITEEEMLLSKITESFCRMSGLEEESSIASVVKGMAGKVQQYFSKHELV